MVFGIFIKYNFLWFSDGDIGDDGLYNMSHMSALSTYPQGLLQALLDN